MLCCQKVEDYHSSCFEIYVTDGFASNKASSISVAKYDQDVICKIKILKNLFSTLIELLAIKQAVALATADRYTKVVIFSDSKLVLLLINKKDSANQNVFEIHDVLDNPFVNQCYRIWAPGFHLSKKINLYAPEAQLDGQIISGIHLRSSAQN